MPRPQGPIVAAGFRAEFAARLRAAREKANLTPEQAAAAAEVSYSAWLMYESGRRMPRLDWLPAIAAAVKTKPQKLMP